MAQTTDKNDKSLLMWHPHYRDVVSQDWLDKRREEDERDRDAEAKKKEVWMKNCD